MQKLKLQMLIKLQMHNLAGGSTGGHAEVKFLCSIFTPDCTLDAEIHHRVAAANSAFQELQHANIWYSTALSVKMQFLQCIVMSVLL